MIRRLAVTACSLLLGATVFASSPAVAEGDRPTDMPPRVACEPVPGDNFEESVAMAERFTLDGWGTLNRLEYRGWRIDQLRGKVRGLRARVRELRAELREERRGDR